MLYGALLHSVYDQDIVSIGDLLYSFISKKLFTTNIVNGKWELYVKGRRK